jgi:hypothetical protein
VKDARGRGVVVARRDNSILHVAIGNHNYQRTPARYLVDVTHRSDGLIDNDLESDSESDLE